MPGMCEAARREPGPWPSTRFIISVVLLLLAVAIGGCADQDAPVAGAPRATPAEGLSVLGHVGDMRPPRGADSGPTAHVPSGPGGHLAAATASGTPKADAGRARTRASHDSTVVNRSTRPSSSTSSAAAYSVPSEAPSVEELLAKGLHLAEASPAHLAIRGTPAAGSVRCAWRGIARTAQQRTETIRFWFQLGATDPVPDPIELEVLFRVVLDGINPELRETAKANFLAIARGGESMDYLFLTCFADYAASHFLLGSGTTPTTVTVAYDRMDEAAAYELYVREHESGTYGIDALQTRGAYEAGLQAQVVAA
ncbi:MAG: hypothetical protein OXG65_00385, partial [Chloroflexi bacterium]|nr:hypothetical protein [Chloroflexota bacterium]